MKRIRRKNVDDIKNLQGQLRDARWDMIDIAPEFYRDLLRDYTKCTSRSEVSRWFNRVVQFAIEHADSFSRLYYGETVAKTYAYCPLCRGGSDSNKGRRGFVLSDGLQRHMNGSHGAKQCKVLKQVLLLARQYVDDREWLF